MASLKLRYSQKKGTLVTITLPLEGGSSTPQVFLKTAVLTPNDQLALTVYAQGQRLGIPVERPRMPARSIPASVLF